MDDPVFREKRLALRHHPRVRAALDEWWKTTDVDGNGEIDRHEYMELSCALYNVLVADGDDAAAREAAADDWEEDRKGSDVMSDDHFRDAIFQRTRAAAAQAHTSAFLPCRMHFLTHYSPMVQRVRARTSTCTSHGPDSPA